MLATNPITLLNMKSHNKLGLLAGFGLMSLTEAVIETAYGTFPDHCPVSCASAGSDPAKWDHLHRVSDVSRCDQPLLFDLNVQNSVSDANTIVTIRTCTQGNEKAQKQGRAETSILSVGNDCGAKSTKKIKATIQTGRSSTNKAAVVGDVAAAASNLNAYLKDASCGSTLLFAKSGSTVVGLYSGADVTKASAAEFVTKFEEQSRSGRTMMQICDENAKFDQTLGIFAGSFADLANVQDAVKTWTNGKCMKSTDASIEGSSLELLVSNVSNSTTQGHSLNERANCRDIQVQSGDSCGSLASKCGISGADFTKYNPGKDMCSTLKPKQYVCCSAGTLPDHTPQPNGDGSCKAYTAKPGDGCFDIADAYGLKTEDIENLNKKTWGWAGCGRLQVGQVFCISKGTPPFPASVANAVCGPQVPGTKAPTDGSDIAKLNPCPLNSCCDVWGFCGVTADFCTKTPADTGAPGTAQPNTNGCISNCGTDIVNNDAGPSEYRSVGYFEAWNQKERDCLKMHVNQIDKKTVTHVHFAFATVNTDWTVSVEDVKGEFDKFKEFSGVKKVLSFGGWAFSTDPSTFQRFRDAAKPANRETFANNCIKFMKDNGLDGLDFDWEYPGAPDIPDIPPSTKEDALNYLKFLQLMKSKMPSGGSLSIAIPASYWYLKSFPVDKMQSVVDYFVYMTYDFHGQWDVANKFSVEGCPDGNCLRSHVNKTETHTALAMITKAGVKSNKLLIGISSYGRSFRMSSPSCGGPNCKYTGTSTKSDAYPGRCTKTGGYISNAELSEIISKKSYPIVRKGFDKTSDSDILMYGEGSKVDWVAYMTAETKKSRVDWIKGLNFGGTSDWAVDLMEFVGENDNPNDDDTCKADDRTYSTAKTTDPMYMPWYLMDPENAAASKVQYVTIVNLTPHTFKLDHTHSYQMKQFVWGDVPPGKSYQASMSSGLLKTSFYITNGARHGYSSNRSPRGCDRTKQPQINYWFQNTNIVR